MLRRFLYLFALAAFVTGAALAAAPGYVLGTLLGQIRYPEYAWVRLFGISLLGLAMLAVLVGHRVTELWWWSWAFIISTGSLAAVFALNAILGPSCQHEVVLPDRRCPAPQMWWFAAAVTAILTGGLIAGLARAGHEGPPSAEEDRTPGSG